MRYIKLAMVSIIGQLIALSIAFLFQFIIARQLGASLYGDLGVMLGIFSILSIPAASFQAVLVREISKLETENRVEEINYIIQNYLHKVIFFGLPASFLVVFVLSLLKIYAHPMELGVILVSVPLYYAIVLLIAYFQGRQRVFEYSTITVLVELFRMFFSVVLVYFGLSLLGISFGYLADMLLLYVGGLVYATKKLGPTRKLNFSIMKNLKFILPTNIIISLLLFTDIFSVKYFLSASETGIYNAASVLAKVIFFANIGLMAAFLPQSSRLDVKKDRITLMKTAVTTAVLLIPPVLILLFFSCSIITLFFGPDYYMGGAPLRTLSVAMYTLALSTMLINLMWSQNEEKLPLIAVSVAIASNAILLYLLVPRERTLGAAKANLLSECLLLVLTLLAVRKTTR